MLATPRKTHPLLIHQHQLHQVDRLWFQTTACTYTTHCCNTCAAIAATKFTHITHPCQILAGSHHGLGLSRMPRCLLPHNNTRRCFANSLLSVPCRLISLRGLNASGQRSETCFSYITLNRAKDQTLAGICEIVKLLILSIHNRL